MKDYSRTLKIVHCYFGYREEDSIEVKVKAIRNRILDLKKKGFGGIVTNVGDVNYLNNETEWKLMKEKARICKENDMRMWLYDEKGYPSGGAETLTISKNPDFEARALVVVEKVAEPGETITMSLPYKHEKTLGIFGYLMEGERLTEEEFLEKPMNFGSYDSVEIKNTYKKNLLVLGFYKKHMYEGAHCQNNVCSSRRYIDVSNKDAVREFINNTYEKYTSCLEGNFAKNIGDESENAVVEAIFTDEPSYMGHYINKGINTPRFDHEPDINVPLYPVINWGRDVENVFFSRYGYRIESVLPHLFMGASDYSRKIRYQYNKVMSDLFAESFYGQLSDFCASKGLLFSGHTLLEDEIKLHVKFEGNIMKFLSKMHVPGIDMLHSVPEIVFQNAFTPLLARSAAAIYGREHVMDEVSAHAQGGNVTIEQVKTSLMLQFALGADIFTSYFDDNKYDLKEQKKMLDGLSSAAKSVGTRIYGDTLVYYPVDTMMCLEKPQLETGPSDNEHDVMCKCQKNLEDVMYGLLNRQVPFLFADSDAKETPTFAKTKNVYIPGCLVTNELIGFVVSIPQDAKIYYIDNDGSFERSLGILKRLTNRKILTASKVLNGKNEANGVCACYGENGDAFVNSTGEKKRVLVNDDNVISAFEAYSGRKKKITISRGKKYIWLKGYECVIVNKR